MDSFTALDVWLRGEPPSPPIAPDEPAASPPSEAFDAPIDDAVVATEAAIADARRFRAAVADALDAAVAVLARDIAADILGRELMLAPPALAAIVREATARLPEIVRVRVHPRDLAALRACGAPAFADAALRPGDAVVEVVDGMHDATLGARFGSVLAAWTVA